MWVRLDDQFHLNPKIEAAGAEAGMLYVCSLSYSGSALTDGFISERRALLLYPVEDAVACVATLLRLGLWERAAGGYQIHDWSTYNPPAADVRERRDANAERQRQWRERVRQSDTGRFQPEPIPIDLPEVVNAPTRNALRTTLVTPAPSPSPSPLNDNDDLSKRRQLIESRPQAAAAMSEEEEVWLEPYRALKRARGEPERSGDVAFLRQQAAKLPARSAEVWSYALERAFSSPEVRAPLAFVCKIVREEDDVPRRKEHELRRHPGSQASRRETGTVEELEDRRAWAAESAARTLRQLSKLQGAGPLPQQSKAR